MSNDPRKDLPPASSPQFLEKVREAVQVYLGNRGDPRDRGVTLRDLESSGLARLRPGFGNGGSGGPIAGPGPNAGGSQDNTPDLTPPPTPEGFEVSAAFSSLFIEHDMPRYTMGHGHARTIVYGATWTEGPKPTFANAVPITAFDGTIFAHPTNPATTWHLWIKWQSKDGEVSVSPAGGLNGLVAVTGQDVEFMVAALTGPGKPFTELKEDTLIDGVMFPAGIYSTRAFVLDAEITRAKIKDLAVDNAKIANVSAAKLTAGAIDTGDITSTKTTVVNGVAVPSFSINGSTGFATFRDALIYGTVYANAGEFRGIDIKDAAGNVILSAKSPLKNQISAALPDGLRGNLLDLSSWVVNSHDRVEGFQLNGGVYETYRRSTTLPDGSVGCSWFCYPGLYFNGAYGWDNPLPAGVPAGDQNGDGGWNTDYFNIDKNRAYRFSTWVRREGGGTGVTYLGCGGGSVHTMPGNVRDDNPYFYQTPISALIPGVWYLMVGYVYPAGEAGQPQRNKSGLYNGTTGAKVADGIDYCWAPTATTSNHRAYLFYSAPGSHIDLAWPRVDVANGSEPSLAQLLAGGNVSARNKIDAANITTFINPGAIGNTQIGGDIFSSNWLASGGASGWYLQRDGFIYARSGIFSGSLSGADISGATGWFTGNVQAASFFTPGNKFAAYSDGTVIADNVDIRRRIVLQNGVYNSGQGVAGTYAVTTVDQEGTAYSYSQSMSPGMVQRGRFDAVVLTDIYDPNTLSTSNNQPYYVAALCDTPITNYQGANGTILQFVITGQPTVSRTYSNTGQYPDDSRIVISFDYVVLLVSGSFGSFTMPPIRWTLYKL
jgi:hypothetical protein